MKGKRLYLSFNLWHWDLIFGFTALFGVLVLPPAPDHREGGQVRGEKRECPKRINEEW
jgi:hypothetical protein